MLLCCGLVVSCTFLFGPNSLAVLMHAIGIYVQTSVGRVANLQRTYIMCSCLIIPLLLVNWSEHAAKTNAFQFMMKPLSTAAVPLAELAVLLSVVGVLLGLLVMAQVGDRLEEFSSFDNMAEYVSVQTFVGVHHIFCTFHWLGWLCLMTSVCGDKLHKRMFVTQSSKLPSADGTCRLLEGSGFILLWCFRGLDAGICTSDLDTVWGALLVLLCDLDFCGRHADSELCHPQPQTHCSST